MSVVKFNVDKRHIEALFQKARQSKKYVTINLVRSGFSEKRVTLTGNPGPLLAPEGPEGTVPKVNHHFNIKVTIEVLNSDQGIEFSNLVDWINSLYDNQILNTDDKEVNTMADELYVALMTRLGTGREVTIEIIASIENEQEGCVCHYNKN